MTTQAPTAATRTPSTWGGHSINDGTIYVAKVADKPENAANPQFATVSTPIIGNFPVQFRQQPSARTLLLTITIKRYKPSNGPADLATLRSWFDGRAGPQFLVATDYSGTSIRIHGQVESFLPRTTRGDAWAATIVCSTPVWERTALDSLSPTTITATGQTFTLVNSGSAWAFPKLTITPNAAKSHAVSQLHRRRIVLTNQAQAELGDPECPDGYPIELSGT